MISEARGTVWLADRLAGGLAGLAGGLAGGWGRGLQNAYIYDEKRTLSAFSREL